MPVRPLLCLLIGLLGLLSSDLQAVRVSEIRLAQNQDSTRAVIELDRMTDFRLINRSWSASTLSVEVDGVLGGKLEPVRTGEEKLVSGAQVEINRAAPRMRLDLRTTGPVNTTSFQLESPARIVIDMTAARPGSAPPAEVASAAAPTAAISSASSVPSSAPQPPLASARRRPKVIIDPGHGGYHKGAGGTVNGRQVWEKEVTIKVAEKLERLLKADPRFDVDLTRRQDVYIGLLERTQIASRMKGDIFISLHCNAVESREAQKRARGFEIWIWNRQSNNSAAARAIERLENDEPGVNNQNNRILTTMMIDALESQAIVSRRLARAVHSAFMSDSYFRQHDRGIDSARFKVLETYDMPSILVELGFMTHPEEVKLLTNDTHQTKMARYLYDGIVKYYEETDPSFRRAPISGSVASRAQ